MQQTLEAAVSDFQAVLTPAQKAQLLASSTKPDATAILSFTAEVDRVNAHRRSRCVSSRLFGVLQSVQDFSNIVDTFVSSNPNIAALVWGSLKFTILAVNNITSYFDKLSECFLRLSNYCPRYTEYQLLFKESTRLQEALCSFYTTIIQFCTKAIRIVEAPGPSLVKSLWKPFENEFRPFEDELRKHNNNVREEIKLAAEQAAARERESARKERTQGSLFRSEATYLTKETRDRRLQRDRLRAKAQKETLLRKLSSHDYIGPLKRIRKKRHGTTGSWLTETTAFKTWFAETKSSTLWLSGILGSGKSVVTAAAINELLCHSRRANDHIGFFFCEYDNANSLSARIVLGTLIRQCLTADSLSEVMESRLKNMFDGNEGLYPDIDDFAFLLGELTATSTSITFVVDGLDECTRKERMILLNQLHCLVSTPKSIVKIFFSSRELVMRDIASVFDSCLQVTMDCAEARADIPTYVKDVVTEKIENAELVVGSPQLIHEIIEALVKGANGMFLWVAFQIGDLCQQVSDAEIRKSLKKLPKDLPETYERALFKIIREGSAEIAEKIFQWVAAAKRPLKLEELREAITVEIGDRNFHQDRLVNDADRMIPYCGSLVISDEEDLQVQFVHHTVKEFLLSQHYTEETKRFHFQLPQVDHFAGEICVTYLGFSDFERQVAVVPKTQPVVIQAEDLLPRGGEPSHNLMADYGLKFARMVMKRSKTNFNVMHQLDATHGKEETNWEKLHSNYPFLAYASEFWLSHTVGFDEKTTLTWPIWKYLVLNKSPIAMKPWTRDNEERTKEAMLDYILNENHFPLVTYSFWCQYNHISGAPYVTDRDLLLAASRQGHHQFIDYILQIDRPLHKREIPTLWKDAMSQALYWAVANGHMKVVDRLVATECGVYCRGPCGAAALHVAASNGDVGMVERLLAAGALVDADLYIPKESEVGRGGFTAIQISVIRGHLALAEKLVTAGTDFYASEPYTAVNLKIADYRNVRILEMLLEPIGVMLIHVLFDSEKCRKRGLSIPTCIRIINQSAELARGTNISTSKAPPDVFVPIQNSRSTLSVTILNHEIIILGERQILCSMYDEPQKAIGITPGDMYVNESPIFQDPFGSGFYVEFCPCAKIAEVDEFLGLATKEMNMSGENKNENASTGYYEPPINGPSRLDNATSICSKIVMLAVQKLLSQDSGVIMIKFLEFRSSWMTNLNITLEVFQDDRANPLYLSPPIDQSGKMEYVALLFVPTLKAATLTLRITGVMGRQWAEMTGNTKAILEKCLYGPTPVELKETKGERKAFLDMQMRYFPVNMDGSKFQRRVPK